MKVRDVIKRITADGWYYVNTEGNHRQFKHPTKPGKVTVSGHPNKDMDIKTLKSIWTQSRLRP